MKILAALVLFATPLVADDLPAPLALKTAANAFLASLNDDARAKATFPFDADERENWHYTPRDREGLALKEMTQAQRHAATALVHAVLSEKGALQAEQIMSLEGYLAVLENNPRGRDPEKYYLAVFGTPGDDKGWGLRFEGHHLSVNVALAGSGVSVTPSFMGTNPAEVREGEMKGLRPLAAEEDLARALAVSLRDSGKTGVVFSEKPPGEILTGEDRVADRPELAGIAAADMSADQLKALFDLIAQYTGRYRKDLAADDMKRIRQAGIGRIHFGWAGSLEPGQAYYYRIQGPTFLMEAANTQNNANHMHAVWRDFDHDFGRDLLKEHYEHHE